MTRDDVIAIYEAEVLRLRADVPGLQAAHAATADKIRALATAEHPSFRHVLWDADRDGVARKFSPGEVAANVDTMISQDRREMMALADEPTIRLHACRGTRTRVHAALSEEAGDPPAKTTPDEDAEVHHGRQKAHGIALWKATDALVASAGITETGRA